MSSGMGSCSLRLLMWRRWHAEAPKARAHSERACLAALGSALAFDASCSSTYVRGIAESVTPSATTAALCVDESRALKWLTGFGLAALATRMQPTG